MTDSAKQEPRTVLVPCQH